MTSLVALGIETITLDVLSDSSITACVRQIQSLDILVNNAGAIINIPFSDIDILKAKQLFDLNVWSYIAVTQAFLPSLLQSQGIIINQTSISSAVALPFQSVYSASKAAIAMFSLSQRLELAPFGITVIELKTGTTRSNLLNNQKEANKPTLPRGSIFEIAKERVEMTLSGSDFNIEKAYPADKWAREVVHDVLKKNPTPIIWRGEQAWIVRLQSVLPFGWFDGILKKMTGLDVVEQNLAKEKS